MSNKKCHFPGCIYKYWQSNGRSLFSLPTKPDKRQRLINQLELPVGFDINNSSTFNICSEHFAEGSIVVSGGRTFLGENPTIKGREHLREFSEKVGTFSEFIVHYPEVVGNLVEFFGWKTLIKEDDSFVCFYIDRFDPEKGMSNVKNIIINSEMLCRVVVLGKLMTQKTLKLWSEVAAILSDENNADQEPDAELIISTAATSLDKLLLRPSIIEDQEVSLKLKFLIEQLRNLLVPHNNIHYSDDTLCAALVLKSISKSAYDCLKSFITLPSDNTLSRISNQDDVFNSEKYFAALFKIVPTLTINAKKVRREKRKKADKRRHSIDTTDKLSSSQKVRET